MIARSGSSSGGRAQVFSVFQVTLCAEVEAGEFSLTCWEARPAGRHLFRVVFLW